MLTLILRVTQKQVSHPPKIKTPFICHESFSPKFFICQKEVCGYAKKRETHEALKIAKEKKKKMEHMKVPSVEKRKNKDSPYFQGNYQKERKS
jgi:hypothetical protein